MFFRMCGFPNKNAMSPTVRIPLNHPFARPRKITHKRLFLSFLAKPSICAHISREIAKAGTAESVIGIVLLVGLVLTWIRLNQRAGSAWQFKRSRCLERWLVSSRFAIGVGPRTAPDIAYNVSIVVVVVCGLVVTARARAGSTARADVA